ncbi:hypothetical protein KIN20_035938 [Parelaphostrongylus tenuis]|uniref:Vitellogenin receptor n=1 Tax=Parelaphostrongylus tenuis TaxID=148309 RepID=A0AAD5WLA8_PARTN|nr:hypothetical protein KIN20_035938 [Parelaphostrongylus tenuis]
MLLVTELKRNITGNFTVFNSYNTTATSRFRAAVVYRPKPTGLQNACSTNNGGCSHLCVMSGHQRRCLCAYSILQPDNSCRANPSFISYSHGIVVDFVSVSPNATVPRRALRSPEIPLGITVVEADPDRNQLILVDSVQNRIIIFRFATNNWYSVADDVGDVKGISLDANNRELYYTRLFPPSIWRLSLSADDPASYPVVPTRVSFLGQDNKPKDIVVHPCRMQIFFTNVGIVPSIERMYYSGYKRVVVTAAGRPLALAIMENWLIYSRSGLELVIADKLNGLSERVIAVTTAPVDSITVSAKDGQRCNIDICASLGCSDECRLSAQGEPHCVCRGERKLGNDNVTCTGNDILMKKCAMNEFLCEVDSRCIPYEETCDRYPDCAHGEDESDEMCSQRTCRLGYFNCGNGLCVTLSKKCDRNNDCLNFADELNCECNAGEFRCESGICIASNLTCDFKPDCNDASDEKNCPPRNCTTTSNFDIPGLINCNGTTQCILPQWRCDGTNDCWDDSDEKDCSEIVLPLLHGLRPCLPSEFTCGRTKSCLPRAWVCDGQKDCADGSDELDCLSSCRIGVEFTCRSGDCIHIEKRCDGKKHCPDGDDEHNCDSPLHTDCNSVSFRCRNDRCISLEWICDGANDCDDATSDNEISSDEANCTDMAPTCMLEEFYCRVMGTSYRSCLANVHRCDGFLDCTDGSDENRTECARLDRCQESEFRCQSGQCIPKSWTCNEIADCSDQSDEDKKICTTQSSKCRSDEVVCVKDTVTTCISQEVICNQTHECENLKYLTKTMCGVNECKFDLCEEECVDLPFSYRCECRSPKVTDPKNPARCIMGDQCAMSNCSQFCIEKGNGNYECACAKGYLLESDGHGCKLKSKLALPMLLSMTSDGIRMHSLRDSHQTLPINSSSGRVLAFSVRLSCVYWIDENETVGRTFTNGTSMLLHEISLYCPDSLAVDEYSENIYWTSKSRNAIMMSDSESRYIKTFYRRGPGVLPYALAIDSSHRCIFWTDIGKKPSLNRMSVIEDDRGVEVLLDSSLMRPTALAVDPFARRIYWVEQALNYIGACNYDGTNRRILVRKVSRGLYGLDVFGDFVYVSDFSKGTIERIRKLDAAGNRTVVITGLSHPKGIQVIHPEKWPKKNVHNPCLHENTCTQLCVPSNNEQEYRCFCRDGMRYDNGKCVDLSKPFKSSNHVIVIDYATVGKFVLALVITGALLVFFFQKNRSYIITLPSLESHQWEIEGQERFPLSSITLDGGVENPVFEPNEGTPMDPEANDGLAA